MPQSQSALGNHGHASDVIDQRSGSIKGISNRHSGSLATKLEKTRRIYWLSAQTTGRLSYSVSSEIYVLFSIN